MSKIKKAIIWTVLILIAVSTSAMYRTVRMNRMNEEQKNYQYGATETTTSGYIKVQATKQQVECTSLAWSFKQWASFRDAGMAQKDVYTFLTSSASIGTQKRIASALRWIYKDRSGSTPEGIAAEIAASCVTDRMPIGLED